MADIPVKLIPVTELADRLDTDDAVTALAIAFEELCIAWAMVLIHGPDRGALRYLEMGGRIRSLPDGSPALLWFDGITTRF